MSFYNMCFGQNPISDLLLAVIGLTKDQCGRFRDCYVEDGMICVYTRNGGGNRTCWNEDNPGGDFVECSCPGCAIEYRLPSHPLYIKDRDDDFDSTYATIYFRIPDEYKDVIVDHGAPGEDRWNQLFEALKAKARGEQ